MFAVSQFPVSPLFANNLLILTVYVIVVGLVFNKAFQFLENLVKVEPNSDDLNQQLENQGMTEIITIKFPFAPQYKTEELKTIPIEIKNTSTDSIIEVDGKQNLIEDFDKQVRQLFRVDTKTEDVSENAVKIFPTQTYKESLSDSKVASPLFDNPKKPERLKDAAQKEETFAVVLFLIKVAEPGDKKKNCTLRCQFTVKKVPWQQALTLALTPK